MIYAVEVTNYAGESLYMDLRSPESSGLLITGIDGVGGGKSDVHISEIATMDGGLVASSRMGQRSINLTIRFMGDDIEALRHKALYYFPAKREVRLTFYGDNRTSYIDGVVEESAPDIFSNEETTQISIVCADPHLYDVIENKIELSGVIDGFYFPFSNEVGPIDEPLADDSFVSITDRSGDEIIAGAVYAENIVFGYLNPSHETQIYHAGEIEIGMEFRIRIFNEPVRAISLYKVNSNEAFHINPLRYVPGTEEISMLENPYLVNDEIVITTYSGHKTATLIRNGVEYSIFNVINDSDTWLHLTTGNNVLVYVAGRRVSGSTALADANDNVTVYVTYRMAYEGM